MKGKENTGDLKGMENMQDQVDWNGRVVQRQEEVTLSYKDH